MLELLSNKLIDEYAFFNIVDEEMSVLVEDFRHLLGACRILCHVIDECATARRSSSRSVALKSPHNYAVGSYELQTFIHILSWVDRVIVPAHDVTSLLATAPSVSVFGPPT